MNPIRKSIVFLPFLTLLLLSVPPARGGGLHADPTPAVIRANNGRYPARVRYSLPIGAAQAWLTDDGVWLSYIDAPAGAGATGFHLQLDFGTALEWTVEAPEGLEVCVANPDGVVSPAPAVWRLARAPLPGGGELVVSAHGLAIALGPSGLHPRDRRAGSQKAVHPFPVDGSYSSQAAAVPLSGSAAPPVEDSAAAFPENRLFSIVGPAAADLEPGHFEGADPLHMTILGGEVDLVESAAGLELHAAGRPLPISWAVPLAVNGQPAGGRGGAPVQVQRAAGESDPQLLFSTYIGGTNWDEGEAIVRDSLGRTYVAGQTLSMFFPTAPGPFRSEAQHNVEAFIARLSWSGAVLDYICTIRGDIEEWGPALAVDPDGSAYLVGRTDSTFNFPFTPGAYDTTFNGGFDFFLMKFDPGGSLVLSTLLGGGEDEFGGAVAIGPSGLIYVTGSTTSDGDASAPFPTTGDAYKTVHAGGRDIFLAVFSADGSSLVYSSLAGGSGNDHAEALRLFGSTAVLAGWTASSDFDAPAGGYDTVLDGTFDALVLALEPGSPSLDFWTYLGGTPEGLTGDRALGLDVDAAGRVYIAGSTYADDFPVTPGAFDETFDDSCGVFPCAEGYAAAFSADGADLLWATYLGGDGEDTAEALKLDAAGDLVLAGTTGSTDFPVSPDALDDSPGGGSDAFVARLSGSGASLPYATYLGGAVDEAGRGVWVTAAGWIAATGWTTSPDFPTTPGSYDPVHNDDKDVFVTVLIPPGSYPLMEILLPIVLRD